MCKTIQLASGEKAIVSDEDFEYLSSFNWRIVGRGYAATGLKSLGMHCVVLERKLGRKINRGFVTDHINENKLDNRRENLRELTPSENVRRSRKRQSDKTSRFVGVSRHHKKWRVLIRAGGEPRVFGHYHTEWEAGKVAAQIFADLDNWEEVWERIQKEQLKR